MLKTKIAVLVSGGGTNLQAIIDAEKSGILKSGTVVKVISSNAEAYALTRASENGIPTAVVSRGGKTSEEFEAAIEAEIRSSGAEIIVLAGFMSILTENFVSKYDKRIINVHPSLIPSFCGKGFYGLRVHQAALDYGVKVTGATVHYVNSIPDGGEIIMQKAVYIEDGDTPETLQKRVMREAEHIILPQAVEKVSYELIKNNVVVSDTYYDNKNILLENSK